MNCGPDSRRAASRGVRIAAAALVGAGALALGLAGPAAAQSFPSKPIHLIVPFAPGGSTDIAARALGIKLGEILGQSIVVENRAGGGTVIATRYVAQAAPDGYTLLYGTNTLALNPTLRSDLPYDTMKDLRPVGMIARQPFVLAVTAGLPVKSVKELVDYAKANPKAVNYGTAGTGTGNHLAQELFSILSGAPINHVPYQGDGPMVIDMVAGRIQMTISTVPSVMQFIESGKLRALGVGDAEELPQLPGVPPISKAGVPDYVATAWNAMFAPGATPDDVVNKIGAALKQALADKGLTETLSKGGAVPAYSPPAEATTYLISEIKKWGEVIKARNIQVK